jgi:hypothetical protein
LSGSSESPPTCSTRIGFGRAPPTVHRSRGLGAGAGLISQPSPDSPSLEYPSATSSKIQPAAGRHTSSAFPSLRRHDRGRPVLAGLPTPAGSALRFSQPLSGFRHPRLHGLVSCRLRPWDSWPLESPPSRIRAPFGAVTPLPLRTRERPLSAAGLSLRFQRRANSAPGEHARPKRRRDHTSPRCPIVTTRVRHLNGGFSTSRRNVGLPDPPTASRSRRCLSSADFEVFLPSKAATRLLATGPLPPMTFRLSEA